MHLNQVQLQMRMNQMQVQMHPSHGNEMQVHLSTSLVCTLLYCLIGGGYNVVMTLCAKTVIQLDDKWFWHLLPIVFNFIRHY